MKQIYTNIVCYFERRTASIAWIFSAVAVLGVCCLTVYMHSPAMLLQRFPAVDTEQQLSITDQRLLDLQILEFYSDQRRSDRLESGSLIVDLEIVASAEPNEEAVIELFEEQKIHEHSSSASSQLLAPSESSNKLNQIKLVLPDDQTKAEIVHSAASEPVNTAEPLPEAVDSTVQSSSAMSNAMLKSSSSLELQPEVLPESMPTAVATEQSSDSSKRSQLPNENTSSNLVIHPVSAVPNWGAMTKKSQWNRTYAEIPTAEYVPVPRYSITDLVKPMQELLRDRKANESLITAKLYYSTRHFGAYDLDSGEYTWKHAGIDLKLPLGTPFSTIAAGTVYDVRSDSVLGTHVIVEHTINGETYYSMYGHMQTSYVKPGQQVRLGELIGTVGNSATEVPHIHLQINRDDPEWRSVRMLSPEVANIYTVHPIEFIEQY